MGVPTVGVFRDPNECFEPFIFAWFAVNGWAACVTGLDADHEYIAALMRTEPLSQAFDRLMADCDRGIGRQAQAFAGFWPIFRVQTVRERGISTPPSGSRAEVVAYYLRYGVNKYQPQCWVRHKQAGEQIPVDWPHSLAALYRVRSNLFHGEKAVHSEEDRSIVGAAFDLLSTFMRSAALL